MRANFSEIFHVCVASKYAAKVYDRGMNEEGIKLFKAANWFSTYHTPPPYVSNTNWSLIHNAHLVQATLVLRCSEGLVLLVELRRSGGGGSLVAVMQYVLSEICSMQ